MTLLLQNDFAQMVLLAKWARPLCNGEGRCPGDVVPDEISTQTKDTAKAYIAKHIAEPILSTGLGNAKVHCDRSNNMIPTGWESWVTTAQGPVGDDARKIQELILSKDLGNAVANRIDNLEDIVLLLDGVVATCKQAESEFAKKDTIANMTNLNMNLQKLRNFAGSAMCIDHILNVLPMKRDRAKRAATARECLYELGHVAVLVLRHSCFCLFLVEAFGTTWEPHV